jgi:hypothetical protein
VVIGSLAAAMLMAAAPVSQGEEGASFDDLRFTTELPSSSTGVHVDEDFNSRDSNGQLKRMRHARLSFPEGTILSDRGAELCTATEQDFRQKGLSACPKGSIIGTGTTTTVTSGTPAELGPITLDSTAFNEATANVIVFTSEGSYQSMTILRTHGTFQEGDAKVICVVPAETNPCPHGEFIPKSLHMFFPPQSRTIGGHVYNVVTTPPTCTAAGWDLGDTHTFADGSQDPFVNHLPCRRTDLAGGAALRVLRLSVRPGKVRAGRRTCFRFATTDSGGAPVAGAKVRFGRLRGLSDAHGALRLCERPRRRGVHEADAAKAGFVSTAASLRVR